MTLGIFVGKTIKWFSIAGGLLFLTAITVGKYIPKIADPPPIFSDVPDSIPVHAAPPEVTKEDATADCATSIDKLLRDPQSAEYQYSQSVAVEVRKVWTVILPVRAVNGFGGHVTDRFICRIENGTVTGAAPIR